jgi:L-amino acid ligase C-terminal domain 2
LRESGIVQTPANGRSKAQAPHNRTSPALVGVRSARESWTLLFKKEVRINDAGPWLIELATRSIGGLCSPTLRFGTGMSLEEIILRHALGWPIASLESERPAAGVMMIPVPSGGVLEKIRGLEAARAVAGIEDVTISIPRGHPVIPLPEGSRYLGFASLSPSLCLPFWTEWETSLQVI